MTNFSMTPPKQESQRNEILLQAGPYPAILVRIYGVGTQERIFPGQAPKLQNLIKLVFELPTVMHEFIEGKGLEPKWITATHTFSLYGSSNLAKLIVSAIGRPLTDDEVNNFDIGQLLGKVFMAQVSVGTSKKDSTRQFNMINTASLVTEQVKKTYNVDWSKIVPRNEIFGFGVDPDGKCFTSPLFGKLTEWLRKEMLNSVEGKAFIAGGGIPTPSEKDKPQGQPQGQPQAQPVTQQTQPQAQPVTQQTQQSQPVTQTQGQGQAQAQPVTQGNPVQQTNTNQGFAQAGSESFPDPDNFM